MTEQLVDERRLEEDLAYRMRHLKEFMGITEEDEATVRATLRKLTKHAEAVVDSVYEHLFRWSSTAKFFVDEDGMIEDAFLRKRKDTLTEWLVMVGEARAGGDFASYMVNVGFKHTEAAGDIRRAVPRHYMIALMSVVQTTVAGLLAQELDDPEEVQSATVAWNKILMLSLELMLSGTAGSEPG